MRGYTTALLATCALASLAGCAPVEEALPLDGELVTDEEAIAFGACPGGVGTVCSGSGATYSSVLRVGRAGGRYAEVAQTFTVTTPGYPDRVRLLLRLLRPLPQGETGDVVLSLRPAPGGVVPVETTGDIASVAVSAASLSRLQPSELDLAFVPTNVGNPARLTAGLWALVVSVPGGDGVHVGVASLQTSAFVGAAAVRGGPTADPARAFSTLLAGGNVAAFAVTLRALAVASAAPTSLTFPGTYTGQLSAVQVVTVTNSGDDALVVAPSVSGPFSVVSNGCSAPTAPGGTCTVSVAFAPTVAGAATGTLTLDTNAVGGAISVPLSGTGVLALVLSGTRTDYVVSTALGNPTQAVDVTVDIATGATLDGSTNTAAALSTGSLPAGSTVRIINRGAIRGGRAAADGTHGGTAIRVAANVNVTIDNHGNIFGAGGRGGRGGRGGAGGGGSSAQGAAGSGGSMSYGGYVGYGGAPGTSSGGGAAGAQTWYGPSTAGTAGAGGNSCYVGNAPWAGGGNGTGGKGAGYGGGGGGCSFGYAGGAGGGFWGGAGGGGGLDNANNNNLWQYTVNGTEGGNGGAAIEIPAGYTGSITITARAGSAIAGAVWNDLTGRYYTGSFTALASTTGQTPQAPAGLQTWNNGIGLVYR